MELLITVMATIFLGVALNQQVSAVIYPAIADIQATPSSVTEGTPNPVKFTAFITSIYGVDSARLEIINQTGTVVDSFSLYDDGTNGGDELARDEIFTQIKNISALPPGTYDLQVTATIPVEETTGTKTASDVLEVKEKALMVQPLTEQSTYTLIVKSTADSAPSTGVYIGYSGFYNGTTEYKKEGITSGKEILLTAPSIYIQPSTQVKYYFVNWSGCDKVGSRYYWKNDNLTCWVTMNTNKEITANYTSGYTLTVNSESITGIPITIGYTLIGDYFYKEKDITTNFTEHNLEPQEEVTLTAPLSYTQSNIWGQTRRLSFGSWGGCDSATLGSGTCNINMKTDKEVTAYYVEGEPLELMSIEINGNSAEKFDLFFMGDGFNTDAKLENKVKELINHSEGLFDTEPFKSNRTKFNIWAHRTGVRGSEDGVTLQMEADHLFPNYDILIYLGTHDFRSFASYPYAEYGWKGKIYLSIGPTKGLGELPRRTLGHEMGHAFGAIKDEYKESGKSSYPGYPNCAGSMSEAQMWWGDLEGLEYYACSILGVPVMHEVAFHEGCSYVSANIKPHKHTIMKGKDIGCGRRTYGLVSDSQLCHLLGSPTTEYCSQIPELPPLPTHTLSVDSSLIQNIPIDSTTGHEGNTPYITDVPIDTLISLIAPCTYKTSSGLCRYVSGGITYTFSGWSGCRSTSPYLTTIMFKIEDEETQKECTNTSSCYATCTANYEAEE